jgi:hypothetical protein
MEILPQLLHHKEVMEDHLQVTLVVVAVVAGLWLLVALLEVQRMVEMPVLEVDSQMN